MTDPLGKRPCFDYSDILVEILSWLPAKALLRFRCVCRSWLNLISTSYFIEKHVSHAGSDSSRELRLLSPFDHHYNKFKDYEFPYNVNDDPAEPTTLHLPKSCTTKRSLWYRFIGSCNGLICLGDRDLFHLVLWNPCTREASRIPKQPPPFGRSPSFPMCYGFVYDGATKDYKVIAGYNTTDTIKIVVYTLRTNSWRIVEVLQPSVTEFWRREGILVNGALHWIQEGIQGKKISAAKIVSFNLAEEKFQEVIPVNFSSLCMQEGLDCSGYDTSMTIAGIGKTDGGRLFVYVCEEAIAMTIWVMKEYGVENSWTKLVRVTAYGIWGAFPLYNGHPRWIFEDGVVSLTEKHGMVWDLGSYKVKEKAYLWVRHCFKARRPRSYVRTLVSPN